MIPLKDEDYEDAAQQLGCDAAAIKAIAKIESPRGGFNPDGTLTTLFEAHHFHRHTGGKYDASHPNLSSRRWNRALYGKNWQAEQVRLAEAAALDPVAAILSASWGMFQIMGSNHLQCGYADGADMVNDFATGERAQLMALVRFIKANSKMHGAIVARDFRVFALLYNGPAADENNYPQKLTNAYASFGGIPPNLA